MASNWDRIFGSVRTELSEADISRAQRTSDRAYAKVLDKQVKSDPLYKATKPHPLTRLALRDLEMAKAAEARVPEQLAAYGQTAPSDIQSEYDLRDPQQQVNAAIDELRDVDPRTTRMLRDYKAGVRSVGDNPMGAVAESPLRTVRDAALSGLSFMNPVEWFGGYGYGDIRDRMQELERRGLGAEDLGREAGRSDMTDTAIMVAMAPGMVRGLGQLGTGALNLGTKGLRSLHQRLNTVPEARRLENISDINPGASTFSGRTFDPAAQAQSARKAAVLSGAVGAGAMGASDDVEAGTLAGLRSLLPKNLHNVAQRLFKEAPGSAAFTDAMLANAIRSGSIIRPTTATEMRDATFQDLFHEPSSEEYQTLLAAAKKGELRNLPMMELERNRIQGYSIPFVSGHDGRHRTQAASDTHGGAPVPVILRPNMKRVTQGEYLPQAAYEDVGGVDPEELWGYNNGATLNIDPKRFIKSKPADITGDLVFPNDGEWQYIPYAQGGPVKMGIGGSVAGAAKRMAQRAMPAFTEGMSPTMAPRGALSVVKPKGGNWLNNSVEDALRGLKKNDIIAERTRLGLETRPEDAHLFTPTPPNDQVLNNWIEGPLTKYVKTRMASPEDEVRRLADQGVLHFDPVAGVEMEGRKARSNAGMPVENTATTDLGRGWEDLADSATQIRTAANYLSAVDPTNHPPSSVVRKVEASLPWLRTIDPNTKVYGAKPGMFGDLGFAHLVDELSNALDPNSGLPRHLQLTPEAVKNLSMEKAVRRVADINAWRAAQKIEASQKIAGGPGQELVREYAHTPEKPNPKGLRWVELKKPEQMPEGWADMTTDGSRFRGPNGAIVGASNDPRIEELSKQLKYEGDTMGHCVGGYCDDVVSGRSRIFSLRGANGEPHVTIEVGSTLRDPRFEAPENFQQQWSDQAHKEAQRLHLTEGSDDYMYHVMRREQELAEAWAAAQPKDQLRIMQIKGKQNRKPNDEYLPFVQDFVKNPPHGAPWGAVGDIDNAGLRDTTKAFTKSQIKELRDAGVEVPEWATPEEVKQMGAKRWPELYPDVPGLAAGGSVSAGDWDSLVDPSENKLSWDIFSGHNDAEQLEAEQ